MISYDEALTTIRERARILGDLSLEWVDLSMAVGRILAQDIHSETLVPSFDNSAMDGFAINASDTLLAASDAPVELEVIGEIAAGDTGLNGSSSHRGAFEIMTGAPVPPSPFNAVVKIEEVERFRANGKDWIRIHRAVAPLENIRPAGSDMKIGQKLLTKGSVFRIDMILPLAACGITQAPVCRKPRIAILSTGSELVDFRESQVPHGKIRNCTGPYLESKLQNLGCEVINYGLVPDEPQAYIELFKRVLVSGVDLILTTGAVSMGKYDFIVPALKDLKATIHFHKVAIRPAKPLLFAEIFLQEKGSSIPVFGMPGNPVSTAVALEFFVRPYLNERFGRTQREKRTAKVRFDMKKPKGLTCFYKARVTQEEAECVAEIVPQQGSYLVGNFSEANAWVILPEFGNVTDSGAMVEYFEIERGI